MKRTALLLTFSAVLIAGGPDRTFTGVITDSMCGANHQMMKITPDSKCARECVKSDPKVKFALFDGKTLYKLSDQETPAQFAGEKVKVTGTLYPQTGIIQTSKIALAP